MSGLSVTAGDSHSHAPSEGRASWHDGKARFFFLGMALFQAWICVSDAAPTVQVIDVVQLQVLHTSGALLTLLLIIAFRNQLATRITSRAYSVVVSVAAVAGTVMVESFGYLNTLPSIFAIMGTLLNSSSTGALLALWGEGYARLASRALQAKMTLAAMVGCFFVYLFVSALPQPIAFVLIAAFPLLTVLSLRKVVCPGSQGGPQSASQVNPQGSPQNNPQNNPQVNPQNNPQSYSQSNQHDNPENQLSARQKPNQAPGTCTAPTKLKGILDLRFLRLLLYILLCSISVSFLNQFINLQSNVATWENWNTAYSVLVLVFLGAILLEMALRKTEKSSLPGLIALLVTVSFLLYFFMGTQVLAVRILMDGGFFLFVATFYSYLGSHIHTNNHAGFVVFSLGNCANTIGMISGCVIGYLAATLWLPQASYLAIGIIYVVLFICLFLLVSSGNVFKEDPDSSMAVNMDEEVVQFADAVREQCSRAATIYSLSAREEEILGYLVRGRSVTSVAKMMNLSQNTIKTHIEHIYKKLDTHSREDLLSKVESAQQ